MNAVTEIPAAPASDVIAHYSRRLAYETDCWDVYEALSKGDPGFVLIDVRAPALYQTAHVPGAVNLPRGKMTPRKTAEWPEDTLFVVYCAGPHCNGTDKAALKLAELGRRVKVMIGGAIGWADEGFPVATGNEPGEMPDA